MHGLSLVATLIHNLRHLLKVVVCTSPVYFLYAKVAQLVEHSFRKAGVASSILAFGSRLFTTHLGRWYILVDICSPYVVGVVEKIS